MLTAPFSPLLRFSGVTNDGLAVRSRANLERRLPFRSERRWSHDARVVPTASLQFNRRPVKIWHPGGGMISRGLRALVAVVVLTVQPGVVRAQETRTDDLVERGTRYVKEFMQRFSSVVAEEQYVQETTAPFRRRELKSDFLLVSPPGSSDWLQFRDVFEVDGRQVKDREDRLARLFIDGSTDLLSRTAQIRRESARYNLEDVGTLNMPLIAIGFLQPRYRPGFVFTPKRLEAQYGPDVWAIEYLEQESPTVLHKPDGTDLPAHGRVWISETTGRVVRTELLLENGPLPIEIRTQFRYSEEFGINVPVEMRESYGFGNNQMTAVATYGRFRKFAVQSEETFQPPAQSPQPSTQSPQR
jgi:hypothetical protein